MALDGHVIVIIAWVSALIMCFAMGSNDESMGSAYGAKSFSLTAAIIVGASTEVLGSVVLGASVTTTIQGKLFSTAAFADDIHLLMLVFLCATASASCFLIIASYFGWPVSTTHGIIGAVAGAAVGAKGVGILEWEQLIVIVGSWIISPLSGAVVTALFYFLFEYAILNRPDPYRAALRMAPIFYAGGVCGAFSFILFKGVPLPESVPTWVSGVIIVALFFIIGCLSKFVVMRRVSRWIDSQDRLLSASTTLDKSADEPLGNATLSPLYERLSKHKERKVEAVFVMLQMLTAPLVAFARGANDVSNGIGPLAAIIALEEHGKDALVLEAQTVDYWVLLVGGLAIALGLFVLGRKVIKNIGDNITNLTPTRGVCVEVGTAITVLSFSALGVPISSTHTLVGCIFAIGLCMKAKRHFSAKAFGGLSNDESRGLLELSPKPPKRDDEAKQLSDVNWKSTAKIFASWVITIPSAGLLAALSVFLVKKMYDD